MYQAIVRIKSTDSIHVHSQLFGSVAEMTGSIVKNGAYNLVGYISLQSGDGNGTGVFVCGQDGKLLGGQLGFESLKAMIGKP